MAKIGVIPGSIFVQKPLGYAAETSEGCPGFQVVTSKWIVLVNTFQGFFADECAHRIGQGCFPDENNIESDLLGNLRCQSFAVADKSTVVTLLR